MNYNSDRLSNLGRQATSFWYIDFWISDLSTFKTELLNSLLSNINDDGDNNEKTKHLKTRVGMFKNMDGNIPGGNFLGWNFPGGNFPGGSLLGGNFPRGSFPDTIIYKCFLRFLSFSILHWFLCRALAVHRGLLKLIIPITLFCVLPRFLIVDIVFDPRFEIHI